MFGKVFGLGLLVGGIITLGVREWLSLQKENESLRKQNEKLKRELDETKET